MNAQPLSHLTLDRITVGSRTEDAIAATAPPLSWKQRLFVVMLLLIALLLSVAVVCNIDPPAVALYHSVRHAAARVAGSSQR